MCIRDRLQVAQRPPFESGEDRYRVADLFAGCGGLTLGVAQACRRYSIGLEIALAVDFEASATSAYRANFPLAKNLTTTSVEFLFDGELGAKPTELERITQSDVGPIHALVGGPPVSYTHLDVYKRQAGYTSKAGVPAPLQMIQPTHPETNWIAPA